jgi:hypothetical protein
MGETDERHDIIKENWLTFADEPRGVCFVDEGPDVPLRQGLYAFGYTVRENVLRAELAAAAPAMVRALLKTEWRHLVGGKFCDACSWRPSPGDSVFDRHSSGCAVDEALTAAGFPDQASRDAARRHLLSGGS